MNAPLDGTLLGEASGLVADRMGLHFPEERWPDLARALGTAGEELGLETAEACVRWLRRRDLAPRQVETLARLLTVGETYFLRDPESFEVLEREILPPLAASRAARGRTLRLWSAGCCTGEEAYSLAITLARALPDLESWNVSILATDINPAFLARAEAGIYRAWSFRGTPAWLRERYFTPTPDGSFVLDPAVRRLVRFRILNLAEDAYPSLQNATNAMDVIFCRNVLMYFTPGHQRRVAAALYGCLAEEGTLFVNPIEADPSLFPMFERESRAGVILYRRTSPPGRATATPVPGAAAVGPPLPAPAPTPRTVAPATAPPAESPLERARALADQGRLEEALASCRTALAAGRTDPAAHLLHAAICEELGRTDEAIAALGRVLYLEPDSILAHNALGGLHRRLGREQESTRHLAIALGLLSGRGREEIVPGSDGMTCGRLVEALRAGKGA